MAIQTISRQPLTKHREATTRELDWSLKAVLHRDTVIAAFESPYEASAAVVKALEMPEARVWQRRGAESGD
jgi:lambda repressor-like predicted transcriptional regulator